MNPPAALTTGAENPETSAYSHAAAVVTASALSSDSGSSRSRNKRTAARTVTWMPEITNA